MQNPEVLALLAEEAPPDLCHQRLCWPTLAVCTDLLQRQDGLITPAEQATTRFRVCFRERKQQ